MIENRIEFLSNQTQLERVVNRIESVEAFALDIETINWWTRDAERVSLVQLAFREGNDPVVMIIDTLAGVDLEPLRRSLELSLQIKVIHNAGFDANKLARHFGIATSPIHDTMLAARRNGEKRCSLKAQVEKHLGIQLDKSEQRSDWARRPLSEEQLKYAALDAACTLMLYERQISLGLHGDFQLKKRPERTVIRETVSVTQPPVTEADSGDLSSSALAMLGIVTELAGRYSPEQLAASVGSERVGLAGWIVDRFVGLDSDIDEESAKQEIEILCQRGLIDLNESRRLESSEPGKRLWLAMKEPGQDFPNP